MSNATNRQDIKVRSLLDIKVAIAIVRIVGCPAGETAYSVEFEELIDQIYSSNEEMKPIFPHREFSLAVVLFATALIILWGHGAMAMTLNSPAFKQ